MKLSNSVLNIKGVGEQLGNALAAVNVKTVKDLINYYPRRYEDYSQIQPIAQIRPGAVTIKVRINHAKGRYVRRGMHITEAVASDDTGSVRLVWFNQPYRAASVKPGTEYYVSGKFELNYKRLSILNPSMELVSNFPVNTARIVPVYPETKILKSLQIRKAIRGVSEIVDELTETLPNWLVRQNLLVSRAEALREIHFPSSSKRLDLARKRLGFEEIFELSLASLLNKHDNLQGAALKIPFKKALAQEFVRHLEFKLTEAQRRAIWQIYKDLDSTAPMNRLLEGDVGSGKTVVAAMAGLMAIKQGWQVAFMAPTELLARQHAETLHRLLKPLGMENQVGLLVGSMKPSKKTEAHTRIKAGDLKFIVGTHALIAEKVDMHKLGLAIIDEQHRFGVDQRKKLQAKAGHAVHVLSMTATPIPRSLALTLYGELDITVIGTKPGGMAPVITKIITPISRPRAYQKIEKLISAGQQMFVVVPLISESEVVNSKSAEETYKHIKAKFSNFTVGLLHGKLSSDDKISVMNNFSQGKLDILVSTTVVEVGVDIPNATIMIIENPERFGLAQIHQLRGRVGRGQHQGYCYLMLDGNQPPSHRIRALENIQDGFKLAELDLELRGPGAIYGTFQHGQLDLKIAKLTDVKLIAIAHSAAQEFIGKKENLKKYPELDKKVHGLRAVTNLN